MEPQVGELIQGELEHELQRKANQIRFDRLNENFGCNPIEFRQVGAASGVRSCAGPYVTRDVVDSSDSLGAHSGDGLLNPPAPRCDGGDTRCNSECFSVIFEALW
jgi:hypothetical protein